MDVADFRIGKFEKLLDVMERIGGD